MLNIVALHVGVFCGLASGRVAWVFLGIAVEETSRLLSLWVHLRSQDAWRDIITVLHVMDGIVWLPWRCALLGERGDSPLWDLLFSRKNLPKLLSRTADGDVNNRIAPTWSTPWLKDLYLLQHNEFLRVWVKTYLSVFLFVGVNKEFIYTLNCNLDLRESRRNNRKDSDFTWNPIWEKPWGGKENSLFSKDYSEFYKDQLCSSS